MRPLEFSANKQELLSLATKDSHFIFDGTLYKQVDGMAMGSHLDPALANNFLSTT